MHRLLELDTDADREQFLEIALDLLEDADLPPYFRCRTLLMLSRSRGYGYFAYACDALHTAERSMAGIEGSGEIGTELLDICKAEFEAAKKDA